VREHCPRGSFCHLEDENNIFDHNLTAHAIAALRSYGTKPLFLAVGFKKPHAPWGTPSRFFDMYSPRLPVAAHPTAPTDMPDVAFIHNFGATLENGTSYDWGPQKSVPTEAAALLRQGYYAAVSYVDEQVGKILAELEALKMSESTIVAFTSDHGYHLGEHGEWEKKANFELTNRVPLIIRAPGIPQSAGKRTTVFYDHVDLYPTLVELAGLPSPQSCNNAQKNTFDYMGYSVRTSAWRYTTWLDWDGQKLQGKWSAGPSFYAEELYSHTNDTGSDHDAYENENVAADAKHKAVKEQLWGMLRARFPSIAKTVQ
jgi:iduronate 2-sulfatase